MSKVLIVDDDSVNRMILEGMLVNQGHQVIQAENGQLAIDSYIENKPEMVLMDIMMPVMNGYEATKAIKELAGDDFVPIIVLTAMTDEDELVKCVHSGADDFLTKPFSHVVLMAKIKALCRMQDLYKTISVQRDEIELNRQILQEEQEQASKIYKRMTTKDEIDGLTLRHHMSPMSLFNGDMLLSAKGPDGTIFVFLTDATGHGLPAALGAFPVRDIFYTMVDKGCSAIEIIEELNRKLVEILPTEFFLCGTMLVIPPDGSNCLIWNGGMPDVVLYRPEENQIVTTIKSGNLPLGIASQAQFSAKLTEITVNEDDSIIMYSDGITEAQNKEGSYFGEKRFLEAVVSSDSFQVLENLLKQVNHFSGDSHQSDDVSIVEYIF